MLQANRRFNLMGPSAEKALLSRHLLDAIPLLTFFDTDSRVADVGSGGGVPGIVLAILSQPPCTIHLMEGVSKKAFFLHHVVRTLGLQERVRVFASRVEQLGVEEQHAYDFVVSRALGSLSYGAQLAHTLLRPGGTYLTLKGRNHLTDLDGLRQSPIHRVFHTPRIHPIRGEGDGVVVQLVGKVSEQTDASASPPVTVTIDRGRA